MSFNHVIDQSRVQSTPEGMQGQQEGRVDGKTVTQADAHLVAAEKFVTNTGLRMTKISAESINRYIDKQNNENAKELTKARLNEAKETRASFGWLSEFLSRFIKSIATEIAEADRKLQEAQDKHSTLEKSSNKLIELQTILNDDKLVDNLLNAKTNSDFLQGLIQFKEKIGQASAILNYISANNTDLNIPTLIYSDTEKLNTTIDTAILNLTQIVVKEQEQGKLEEEINKQKPVLTEKEKDLNKAQEFFLKTEKDLTELSETLSKKEDTIEKAKESKTNLETEIASNKETLSEKETIVNHSKENITKLENSINSTKSSIAEKENIIKELRSIVDAQGRAIVDTYATDRLHNQGRKLNDNYKGHKREGIETKLSKLNETKKELETLKKDLKNNEKELETNQQSIITAEKDIAPLNRIIGNKANELGQLNTTITELANEIETIKAKEKELETAKQQLETAQNEVNPIKDDVEIKETKLLNISNEIHELYKVINELKTEFI